MNIVLHTMHCSTPSCPSPRSDAFCCAVLHHSPRVKRKEKTNRDVGKGNGWSLWRRGGFSRSDAGSKEGCGCRGMGTILCFWVAGCLGWWCYRAGLAGWGVCNSGNRKWKTKGSLHVDDELADTAMVFSEHSGLWADMGTLLCSL